jgi:hypothetical protein
MRSLFVLVLGVLTLVTPVLGDEPAVPSGPAPAPVDPDHIQASGRHGRGAILRPPAVLPYCPPALPYPYQPAMPGMPGTTPGTPDFVPPGGQPSEIPQTPLEDMTTSPFAQASEAGTQPASTFNPNMFGDNLGPYYTRMESTGFRTTTRIVGFQDRVIGVRDRVVIDPSTGQSTTVREPIVVREPITVTTSNGGVDRVQLPIPGRYNGIKVQDNESPRPVDRVYYAYNFFYAVNRSLNPDIARINAQRQTIGFEKTFLDENASIGIRLPFVRIFGPGSVDSQVIGDLTVLTKFALINDYNTGDVFSIGFNVTAPTGGGGTFILVDGSEAPHSTLLQPWAGYLVNRGNFYTQGFNSVVVPTDSRDPTILFNSLAFGYWMYRNAQDRLLSGFVPAVEVHVATPLTHRGSSDSQIIGFADQVNLTYGTYFVFPRSTLGIALCSPLAGPRPWQLEAMLNFNFRF